MIAWLWVTLLVVVLDQLSKHYISEVLTLCSVGACDSIEILPVFKLTLLHNTGAAFSFLDDASGWQRWLFTIIALGISSVLVAWLYRLRDGEHWLALALVLILGGAVGNLVDRISLGYVVDFIVVHYREHYFPAFNLADSCVTVGAGVMIVDMLVARTHPESREAEG